MTNDKNAPTLQAAGLPLEARVVPLVPERDVLDELRDAAARKWHGDPAAQRAGLFARAADEVLRLRVTLHHVEAGLSAAAEDARRYRWLAAHARSTAEHWGGRWSLVIDGPAPRRHDEEDALDEAIDAAMRARGERHNAPAHRPDTAR